MRLRQERAVVMISLSGDAPDQAALAHVPPIVERLAADGLQATWVAAVPAEWPYAGALAAARPRQELALSTAATAARPQFGAQLRREMQRARAAGLAVSTLFAADDQPVAHADLLVVNGITALCLIGGAAEEAVPTRRRRWLLPFGSREVAAPQKLRWGLWRMPAAVNLSAGSLRQVRRSIDQTVAEGGLLHLHVKLTRIEGRGTALDGVLTQIAEYCRGGHLSTRTISATAAVLTRPRPIVSARSILRQRAA